MKMLMIMMNNKLKNQESKFCKKIDTNCIMKYRIITKNESTEYFFFVSLAGNFFFEFLK